MEKGESGNQSQQNVQGQGQQNQSQSQVNRLRWKLNERVSVSGLEVCAAMQRIHVLRSQQEWYRAYRDCIPKSLPTLFEEGVSGWIRLGFAHSAHAHAMSTSASSLNSVVDHCEGWDLGVDAGVDTGSHTDAVSGVTQKARIGCCNDLDLQVLEVDFRGECERRGGCSVDPEDVHVVSASVNVVSEYEGAVALGERIPQIDARALTDSIPSPILS